mmetsp:Transcript_36355/g.53475  ORF Transcript_36355/g.53475 Transcript_36355/m.53475 type:complete len:111 (-) Transcript_36355:107-439(-)
MDALNDCKPKEGLAISLPPRLIDERQDHHEEDCQSKSRMNQQEVTWWCSHFHATISFHPMSKIDGKLHSTRVVGDISIVTEAHEKGKFCNIPESDDRQKDNDSFHPSGGS